MHILGFTLLEFTSGLVGLGFMAYTTVKFIKEMGARKRGLPGNPKRCENHETRISVVESKINNIEAGVNRLLEIHLKP